MQTMVVKPPFLSGMKVIIKKGSRPAIIHEAVGEKTWRVYALDDKGQDGKGQQIAPNRAGEILRSQMLRRPRKAEHFPGEPVPVALAPVAPAPAPTPALAPVPAPAQAQASRPAGVALGSKNDTGSSEDKGFEVHLSSRRA
jgi:hypothetical protein